jgi:hypothetical protein
VALKPAWETALRRTGTAAGDVDLYLQTARVPNSYVAGERSVAVTSRVVQDYGTRRLLEDRLALVGDLGLIDGEAGIVARHQAGGATPGTVDAGDDAGGPAGDVVVVVAHPRLVARLIRSAGCAGSVPSR